MIPTYRRIACLGGVYNNYLALAEALRDARSRGAEAIYCLGDLGAFGPHPDRTVEMVRDHQIECIRGNYDHSIGFELDDCQCGYTDPRDNYFAQISYDYTLEHTSPQHRAWMRGLPPERRVRLGPLRALLCHGSPRKTNEFLWESTTPDHFLEKLADDHPCDLMLVTHTGIKWHRRLEHNRHVVNVGVVGRPENDGNTRVWYTMLEYDPADGLQVDFIPVAYDWQRLAREMQAEGLPAEFIETIRSGWWTTCLEILPGKERRRGKY